MPVRKFFNNTFQENLNDAIFQLQKKQQKNKSTSILTMQGSIREIALYLLGMVEDEDSEEVQQPMSVEN